MSLGRRLAGGREAAAAVAGESQRGGGGGGGAKAPWLDSFVGQVEGLRGFLRYAPAYYAPAVWRLAVAVALQPVLALVRRGLFHVDPAVCGLLWRGSKGGGRRLGPRSAWFCDASPARQTRVYAGLVFDRSQRQCHSDAAAAPPSFLRFALSAAAAARAPPHPEQQRADDGEVTAHALETAVADGSPLLAAALQRVTGNMAGEGKLLNIYHLLQRTMDLKVDGAVVELGCNQGVTACMLQALLVKEARRSPSASKTRKELHVYDSFDGLPAGDGAKDPPAYGAALGSMRCGARDVEANFAALHLPQPVVHEGWFAETTRADTALANPPSIAFAHLDGDLYASILESLNFVYARMPPGAIAVVDDYCDPTLLNRHDIFPGAKTACDEFFRDKPETIVVLPAPHPGYEFPMQYETHAYFQKL